MRQYVYSPQQLALDAWPSGTLRLEGIEVTEEPDLADVFVVPGNFRLFETFEGSGIIDHTKLYSLPYLRGNESRTVVFDCSDNFKAPINLPLIFIRCDVRTWMLPHDPNTIQVAWPVGNDPDGKFEGFDDCVDVPDGGFEFDITCHHWKSSKPRIAAAESCRRAHSLKCDIAEYDGFFGYLTSQGHPQYDRAEAWRRWKAYKNSLKRSRVSLCGESIEGVLPYRLLEAMNAGRISALIGSDYVLPGNIDYSPFTIMIPRSNAAFASTYVQEFLAKTSDAELIERGRLARKEWLDKLDHRRWPELMSYAVQEKINQAVAC